DPKKQGTIPISAKKQIKIVIEYMYKGSKESIELIDLGMFAKEPALHYDKKQNGMVQTGYRSSFGNLLYDFFLDPKIGLGPVMAVQPYIPGDYKGNKYSVIPFVQYELKTGPLKGRYIKFSNLHRIVQNNFIMTLISYDMYKLDSSQLNQEKIKKYSKRLSDILKKISNDFKNPEIDNIVNQIRTNADVAIKDYREKWMTKNFDCKYLKSSDDSQSFYFAMPFTNKPGCENYAEEFKNSDFTKSMRILFQNIRLLPWNSRIPVIPEPEIAAAAKNIGAFATKKQDQEHDLDKTYMKPADIINEMQVPDDIIARDQAEKSKQTPQQSTTQDTNDKTLPPGWGKNNTRSWNDMNDDDDGFDDYESDLDDDDDDLDDDDLDDDEFSDKNLARMNELYGDK
ncbi:MAG: hypothetical protein WD512_05455, partial [Candidatus Paceibacterota bacterium]